MSKIKFTKMVASGNDFIVIDDRRNQLPITNSQFPNLAKKCCDRKYGAGADGMLILEKSKSADFKMRIFNPDGSEAEMCGNGLRCVALRASNQKPATSNQKKIKIETRAGILEALVNKPLVKIKMTEPFDLRMAVHLNISGERYEVNFINSGVPHAILFVNDLNNTNVKGLGKIIRFHQRFLPQGTNVDFVQIKNKKNILLRTYERGVEDETLACGTGAVASAIISNSKYQKSKVEKGYKINVHTEGGEILKVYFDKIEDKFENIWLEGKAEIVYKGVYFN